MVLTPPDYDRDIRHYEFDLKGSGMTYSAGDCLGVYPHNHRELVGEFCQDYGISPNALLSLADLQVRRLVLESRSIALNSNGPCYVTLPRALTPH